MVIRLGGQYPQERFVINSDRLRSNVKSALEMAQVLYISPMTVDKHRTSLMNKLNVHSVVQLMAPALKDGLINPT